MQFCILWGILRSIRQNWINAHTIAESDEIARIQLQYVRSLCAPARVEKSCARARAHALQIVVCVEPLALRTLCLQYELTEKRQKKRKRHIAIVACSNHVFQPSSGLTSRVQGLPTKRNIDGRENGNDPKEYLRIHCYKYEYVGYANFLCVVLIDCDYIGSVIKTITFFPSSRVANSSCVITILPIFMRP